MKEFNIFGNFSIKIIIALFVYKNLSSTIAVPLAFLNNSTKQEVLSINHITANADYSILQSFI